MGELTPRGRRLTLTLFSDAKHNCPPLRGSFLLSSSFLSLFLVTARYEYFYRRGKKWIVFFYLFIFGLPHSLFQSSLRRKIPMDKMTRKLAKMAIRQRPSMYVVIHIKSKVIASRQPGKGALLFFFP